LFYKTVNMGCSIKLIIGRALSRVTISLGISSILGVVCSILHNYRYAGLEACRASPSVMI